MGKIGTAILLVGISIMALGIRGCVKSSYTFENKYLYAWNLSDKSSTIEAKSVYINDFVNNLSSNRENFASHNAVWLKTPNNSFDCNLKALITLRDRLTEIKSMDITSFQYNTAIQQITSQEQGEAHSLISAIQGCYDLKNYWYVWDWIGLIVTLFSSLLALLGISLIVGSCED